MITIFILDKNSTTPLYLQLYQQIRGKIETGEILEGSRLVSIRNLSKELNISKNTVESAYQQLYSEGYVTSKACSGYVVQKIDAALIEELRKSPKNKIKYQKSIHDQGPVFDKEYHFQFGRLDFNYFPLKTWKRIMNQVVASDSFENLVAYNERKGEIELIIEIIKYISASRGVDCQPDQVILCSGTQSCLSLLCQLFREFSTNVAMEEPGYDGARVVFLNNGFNVIPVEIEEDGINLKKLNKTAARLLYLTPSHQFPMGVVLPINKRLKLLDWAEKNNAMIIEDDFDSEFRYNSNPIPSLYSSDTKGRVVYMGTFSKALAPGLRMTYMILPPHLLEIYNKNFAKYNSPVPLLEQAILCKFMSEGHWDMHLRKMRVVNKRRYDILIRTINELMGEKVIVHGRNAGLHIVLELSNSMTEQQLVDSAKSVGVTVYPVSRHWYNKENYSDNMVQLGFSSLSEDQIVEGIILLNKVWFDS